MRSGRHHIASLMLGGHGAGGGTKDLDGLGGMLARSCSSDINAGRVIAGLFK